MVTTSYSVTSKLIFGGATYFVLDLWQCSTE